ncbi:MAG TPA: acyl-CoA dehydrogenase family protein [Acidimicrobiia bacterium]
MDFAPNDDHEMLRAAVRDLASGFGHDYYARCTREGQRPDELWKAVGDHGFLGVHLPEHYGGGGAGIGELAIVCEELAAQGCPLLLILVSAAISAEVIAKFGDDAQKTRFLPGLAAGTKMVFAITEPDAGSNSHRIACSAKRDGDVYRLNGAKTFISGFDEAPQVLVVCRTGWDEEHERARLSLFVVDTDAPGLTSALIPIEIQSPEKQYTLFFDNVEVPSDRLIGEEGEGLRQVFEGLNPERIMSATICTGVGRYALARASQYARDRAVWGTPIGAHQGVAHPLAEAKIELELARLMTEKAAWLHDHGTDRVAAGEAANMAKLASADAGMRCLDQAIQTHGGNGLASEFGLADLWGIVRLLRIAPVSREMVLNFVAAQSLSLPKSY